MKALKITMAILIPVAIVLGILPVVYPLVAPLEGVESDFSQLIESMLEVFKDLSAVIEIYGLAIYIMLIAPIVGGLLLILWIIFGIIKKRPIGILWGFIAAFVLVFMALGVFICATFDLTAQMLDLDGTGYRVMQYIAIGSIVLFIAAFVIHVIIMFKSKKKSKKAQEEKVDYSQFEINYDDLPPVLFEDRHADEDPEIFLEKGNHIPVSPNRVLKGHYVLRQDELDALLATDRYSREGDIPESILEFLHSKHQAEDRGEYLPIFDPNFMPSKEEEAMFTDEELFVIEALRKYHKEANKEEPVPERVRHFLEKQSREDNPDLPMFDPNFVPEAREEELSREDLSVVKAMSHLKAKDDYIDLPMFREHPEEPVEYVEEFVEFIEPEPAVEVNAPKLANAKPVHVSKNKEGKFQLKQVGEDKALAVFDSEEEAIAYAEALKKVNGVAVRIHDSEGKIRSL